MTATGTESERGATHSIVLFIRGLEIGQEPEPQLSTFDIRPLTRRISCAGRTDTALRAIRTTVTE